jgi:hypothetical protein
MQRGLIAGILLMSLIPLANASARGRTDSNASDVPVSQGIVLTIVALDPKTDTATLRADDGGQEFQVTAYASWKTGAKVDWKTGAKVECDLIDEGPNPQLQNCQPW